MPDLEDLGNAIVKDFLQSTRDPNYWFAWRPGLSTVDVGHYCSGNGLTITDEGDLSHFGIELTRAPVQMDLAVSSLSSDNLTHVFTQFDDKGTVTLTTEDLGALNLDAKTDCTYSSNTELAYNLLFDAIAVYSLGDTDTVGFLQNTVWPKLTGDPRWRNAAWVICGKVATSRSYAFAGSVESNSEFTFSMERGAGIKDLFNGKITSDVTIDTQAHTEIHDSSFQGVETVFAYVLYHFDNDGTPQVYTPWS